MPRTARRRRIGYRDKRRRVVKTKDLDAHTIEEQHILIDSDAYTIEEQHILINGIVFDKLNLERLQHVRLIQTIERELAEHTSRTENFEKEIVRLKEENLFLTNTRYRLTMDLKNSEMQDCHFIKSLQDEIQKLKVLNYNNIREHKNLLHELSVAENQN
ncbi:unnamed protein product [Mytilus coruscus]|uniref:Uncharacterized protein n=1 Tax=Mytilus coruscus TaxID=42192 RepID=A0A6J8EJ64_MYTCO|nr:unnamed protein product [Mytilus coruscus]